MAFKNKKLLLKNFHRLAAEIAKMLHILFVGDIIKRKTSYSYSKHRMIFSDEIN
jgi:hypothetical protein